MSITDKEIAMRILFSKRLGDLIEKHGIQQNDLAIRIGVSESTVGKWLLKKAMPRMGTIQKLSDYFSVPKSYFLEESPAAPQEAPAASASFEYTLIPVGISAGQMEDCHSDPRGHFRRADGGLRGSISPAEDLRARRDHGALRPRSSCGLHEGERRIHEPGHRQRRHYRRHDGPRAMSDPERRYRHSPL